MAPWPPLGAQRRWHSDQNAQHDKHLLHPAMLPYAQAVMPVTQLMQHAGRIGKGAQSLRALSLLAVLLPTPGFRLRHCLQTWRATHCTRARALQELFKKLALDLDREGKAIPLVETAFSRVGLAAWPAWQP